LVVTKHIGRGTMKRLGTVALVLVGFTAGIVFVYSCGGGSSSQGESLTWPSPVAATGQIASYGDSDDGAHEAGVVWPDPRFTDNGDGTVTDNLTGLFWLKNANCFGNTIWSSALTAANQMASGSCGLMDGSAVGDWRLPNVNEFLSLVDYGRYSPAVPSGHPFTGLQSNYYHSSTTLAAQITFAWLVSFDTGYTHQTGKTDNFYVWAVRDSI
jgi:hypothetical protein